MNYVHLYKQSKYKENHTYHAIFLKLVKIKDKEKNLESSQKKRHLYLPSAWNRSSS